MLFWITEDFLWFVLNPAFGPAKFSPANVPWHRYWIAGAVPVDYLVAPLAGFVLIGFSYYLEVKHKPEKLSERIGP